MIDADGAVRAARITDRQALAELSRRVHLDPDGYRRSLGVPAPSATMPRISLSALIPSWLPLRAPSVHLVAELDGELVGCAGWRRHGNDAELKRMFTLTAARGRGVARRMLAAVEDSARAAGCRRVILETGDRQPEAIALYEAAGYRRIPDFGYYAGEQGVLSFARDL